MPAARPLHQLSVFVPAEVAEELAAFAVEIGAGAVEERETEDGAVLVVHSEKRRELERLEKRLQRVLRLSGFQGHTVLHSAPRAAREWETAWTEHLEPVPVGRSLVLVPTNAGAGSADSSRRAIRLEPAMTFGFGEHPTTRLAAGAVERLCLAGEGAAVLDVGTGSGVLALVAAASGAERTTGIDVDRKAVSLATKNARRNGLSRQCRFSKQPLSRIRGVFDVVVANIDAGTLGRLAPDLARVTSPRGTLLLTGILRSDVRELAALYGKLGFARPKREHEGDWVLLSLTRPKRVTPPATRASRKPGSRRPRATARRKSRTPRSR